jgi:stringent starvation protein B
MDATSSLKLGNDFIEFKARFGGKPREIMVPIHRVMAIYARENGQGMAFPVSDEEAPAVALTSVEGPAVVSADSEDKPPTSSPGRPALKRIK